MNAPRYLGRTPQSRIESPHALTLRWWAITATVLTTGIIYGVLLAFAWEATLGITALLALVLWVRYR